MRRIACLAAVVLLVQMVAGQLPARAIVAAPRISEIVRSAASADALASTAPPPATAFGFGYDDLGRLVEASDPSTSTATYQWDAAGNLLAVGRRSSAGVSVTQLVPAAAPAGATVRLYGTGFSTTASQDSVTFNGTAATVSSASTFELVVIVPSGATSGTVSVTAPGGSGNSPSAFTITSSRAPTVSSASASIATAGTQLTVAGTGFSTPIADDTLGVDQTLAQVTAASATSLTWTVPGSGSGSSPER